MAKWRNPHTNNHQTLPIRVGVAVHVLVVVEAVQSLPRLHEGELSAEGDLLSLGAAVAAVPGHAAGGPRAVQARAAPARVEHQPPVCQMGWLVHRSSQGADKNDV